MGLAPDDFMLYVAAEVTPLGQGQMGTILQKIHARTGATPWGSSGRMLFNPSAKDQSPRGDLGFIDSKPVVLYSDGFNNGGTPVRLLAAFLDTAGAILDTVPMGISATSKGRVHLSGTSGFNATAVWAEDRGSGSLAFAHRINRTPCPGVSAGAGWSSVLDTAQIWFTGAGADSLYWTLGDGSSASSLPGDTLQHRYAANGSYTAWVYAYRYCGTMDSASVNVVISGIGLSQNSQNSRWIGPNPSRGTLVHRGASIARVQLMNIQGQLVAEVYDWPADELWVLPEGLANGAYVALYENCHQRIHIIR
jgi:hypothetical protein